MAPATLRACHGVTVRRCHGDRQNRRISGSPQLPRAACVRATYRKAVETYSNRAMLVGTEREPDARALYQVRTRRLVDEAGFVRIEGMAAGASPDGLIGDDGLLEIKCPNPATHIDYLRLPVGECPKAYFWQVQGQMFATGRAWCDFVSYHPEFPGELQIVIRRVQRDQQALAKLVMGLGKFLEEVDAEKPSFAR